MGHFEKTTREVDGYKWVDDMSLDLDGKAFNGNIVPVVIAVVFIVAVFMGIIL